ncbi:WW domain-binding protein 4 [Athalia rosae]|uniref:WW domain-binding protein 4 n=1 Tax=Athalia rosae TaxID=37344 RepID=UPI0020336AB2|nr:WW domain-binding protein 4 [Athalia rosae]XP_048506432.1 WW domain-binding protein 4 [Athalia rosae]
MADYWKSQGRKFCDFCKCWIADNKPSIEFHEGGKKHKENVAKRLKEIHKASAKQAKQHRKFEDDLKKMETAAMAAYLKDVENNTKDLTAERIIREKLEKAARGESTKPEVPNPPQLAAPEASPRYRNREFHPVVGGDARKGRKHRGDREGPADVDPCDPSSSRRPRSLGSGKFAAAPPASTTGGGEPKVPGKSKVKGKKGRKGEDEVAQGSKRQPAQQKLWYEAVSPEGYTYYWHVQTNESVWEPPEEGFASIAEQEEEAKEQALQEELMAQVAEEEKQKLEETAEERRANDEREKLKEIRKLREQQRTAEDDDDEESAVPFRRDYSVPEKPDPYGSWKTVQVIKKKPVDLQLPKQEVTPIAVPTLEKEIPIRVFKEKTVSSIHAGDSDQEESAAPTFKKRKFGKINVRKRMDDD